MRKSGQRTSTDDILPDMNDDFIFSSPIDINVFNSLPIELSNLSWHGYSNLPRMLTVTNTGRTVLLNGQWGQGRPYITGGPLDGSYVFSQIHFHWPSEHLVNGIRYPLEMHVVHFKNIYLTQERALLKKDGTVVLVYLFQVTKDITTSMSHITEYIPQVRVPNSRVEVEAFKLDRFVRPFLSDYFLYWGSVSTKTTYLLQWIISRVRVPVSRHELEELQSICDMNGSRLVHNVRDVQPSKDKVYHIGATLYNLLPNTLSGTYESSPTCSSIVSQGSTMSLAGLESPSHPEVCKSVSSVMAVHSAPANCAGFTRGDRTLFPDKTLKSPALKWTDPNPPETQSISENKVSFFGEEETLRVHNPTKEAEDPQDGIKMRNVSEKEGNHSRVGSLPNPGSTEKEVKTNTKNEKYTVENSPMDSKPPDVNFEELRSSKEIKSFDEEAFIGPMRKRNSRLVSETLDHLLTHQQIFDPEPSVQKALEIRKCENQVVEEDDESSKADEEPKKYNGDTFCMRVCETRRNWYFICDRMEIDAMTGKKILIGSFRPHHELEMSDNWDILNDVNDLNCSKQTKAGAILTEFLQPKMQENYMSNFPMDETIFYGRNNLIDIPGKNGDLTSVRDSKSSELEMADSVVTFREKGLCFSERHSNYEETARNEANSPKVSSPESSSGGICCLFHNPSPPKDYLPLRQNFQSCTKIFKEDSDYIPCLDLYNRENDRKGL